MLGSWPTAVCSYVTITIKFLCTCFLDAIDACMYTISSHVTMARTYLSPVFASLPDPIDVAPIVPMTLTVFVIISVHVQNIRSRTVSLLQSLPDTSAVSGCYGPGSYYAWLFNAVIASQSESTNAQAQSYAIVASLGANVYAIAAAIDQLNRTLSSSLYSQPILDASDRVNMVGWIIATIYLLRQSFTPMSTGLSLRLHVLQIGTWMATWLLHTAAMVIYSSYRGNLVARITMCGIPFAFSVLLPLVIVGLLKRLDRLQWNHPQWATATLYTGTTFMSITYVLTPRHYRYDPDSPTAPLAHSKISDADQVTALVAGLMFLVPHLLLTWDGGRLWLTDRIGTLSLTALSSAFDTCVSGLVLRCSDIASPILDWMHSLRDMIIFCVAGIAVHIRARLRKGEDAHPGNMV